MYQKFGLFDSPFKINQHDHPMVGKSQEKTFINIMEAFSNNMSEGKREGTDFISVLMADLGMGKSFFLKKIEDSINTRNDIFQKNVGKDAKIAVSCFEILSRDGRLPTDIMLQFYKMIAKHLCLDGEQFFMGTVYPSLDDKSKASGKEIADLLDNLDPTYKKVILNLDEDCGKQYLAWKWISGERLSKKELETLEVNYSIDSGERAEKYLFQLAKLLKILEYNSLIILLDEFEKILTAVNKKKFWSSWLVVQKVFDDKGTNHSALKPIVPIGVMCSLTPDAWQAVLEGSEEGGIGAVMTRIRDKKHIFEFKQLNDEDAKNLIIVLLRNVRMENFKCKPLFPFENDVVKLINDSCGGNPREIQKACLDLLEEANKTNKKIIDVEFTRKYLSNVGGGDISIGESNPLTGDVNDEAEVI